MRCEVSNLQNLLKSVKEHYIQCWFAMKTNPCLFATQASLLTRLMELIHYQKPCGQYAFPVGFSTLKINPNVFSFQEKYGVV